jgi:hypothetical protein
MRGFEKDFSQFQECDPYSKEEEKKNGRQTTIEGRSGLAPKVTNCPLAYLPRQVPTRRPEKGGTV